MMNNTLNLDIPAAIKQCKAALAEIEEDIATRSMGEVEYLAMENKSVEMLINLRRLERILQG